MTRLATLLVLASSCVWAGDGEAPASIDALLARNMWAAFECSALAKAKDEPEEVQRLFEFGVDTGRGFVQAARDGEMSQEDFQQSVPLGVSMRLGGPSGDFMIGRIYESAENAAIDGLYYDNKTYTPLNPRPKELRTLEAENQYLDSNCELLGIETTSPAPNIREDEFDKEQAQPPAALGRSLSEIDE